MGEPGNTRYSLYLPTTARIGKLGTLQYTIKRNQPNPRHTKQRGCKEKFKVTVIKTGAETANVPDLQGAGVGMALVPARFESESTVTFYFMYQKTALEHHMELFAARREETTTQESSATAARHKSSFDKELQKVSVSNPKWARNCFFIFNPLPFVTFL